MSVIQASWANTNRNAVASSSPMLPLAAALLFRYVKDVIA
jgi:hypothetical protein